MRISIIKEDCAVYLDGFCYANLNLPSIPSNVRALQFNTDENLGHIEFVQNEIDPVIPNENITELPLWANDCVAVWNSADYIAKNPPAPTYEQSLEICKSQAKFNLEETDWVEVPSVSDASNTPHLLNLTEFIEYRNQVRALVVNPVADPTWPTRPTAVWG
jgi:hypothetical protein